MKKLLRIALVGAGVMGANHARIVSQSGFAELALVVDPRDHEGNLLAAKYGAKWQPLLDDLNKIDAVIIAAATEAHFSLAKHCIMSGKPVLIEKPITDNLQQSVELINLAASKKVPIMCGFVERFNPAFRTCLSLIDEPKHILATRHSPYAPRIRTGVAWDLLIHDVDLVLLLAKQSPEFVTSSRGFFQNSKESNSEDVADTLLTFPNGALANVSASRIGQNKVRSINIYEGNRQIMVDLLRRDLTIFRNVDEDSPDEGRSYRQQSIIEIPQLETSEEPLASQFKHFVSLVRGDSDPLAEIASVLPAHHVVNQVINSN